MLIESDAYVFGFIHSVYNTTTALRGGCTCWVRAFILGISGDVLIEFEKKT